MVDYTTPSKHPPTVLSGHARTCAISLVEELQFGPYPVLSREHDPHFCIRPGQADGADMNQAHEAQQVPESLLRYCPSKTWAFSLEYRSWCEVRVIDLHNVDYADVPKTKLYMLDSTKDTLDLLVKSYNGS